MESDRIPDENFAVFEVAGMRIEIEGLDKLFYSIYRKGVSSDELLREAVREKVLESRQVPPGAVGEVTESLVELYRDYMERAGGINFG